MSIIHEALKKAEREREPRPPGLPLHGGVRTARRRWRWCVTTGMLIGLTSVGAGSTWLWLQFQAGNHPATPAGPMAKAWSPVVLEGKDQAAPQPRVSHPLPVPKPLAGAWPPPANVVPSPATPLTLALETQVTAQ